MEAFSRREFFMACGFAGAAGVVSLLSACTKTENDGEGSYTFTVVSGAVLIKSDPKTGNYQYKRRCRVCGWESLTSTKVKGTSVSDSFTCPSCKSKQIIEINVSRG